MLGITDDVELKRILQDSRRIAIVGWSDKPDRASHEVGTYLARHGYEVIGVNPRLAGSQGPGGGLVYATVGEIPEKVDLVDVFRRPDMTEPLATQAVAAGAKVFWMQLRVINDASGAIAESGGLEFVQDRCTKIDHMRLIRGISIPANW